jgi:hypothetical protein
MSLQPWGCRKDLANEREILSFAQNDSFAVTLVTLQFR